MKIAVFIHWSKPQKQRANFPKGWAQSHGSKAQDFKGTCRKEE